MSHSELEDLIASRIPLIAVQSNEEAAVMAILTQIARNRKLPLWVWSAGKGLVLMVDALTRTPRSESGTQDPADALRFADACMLPGIFVLLDFHPYLSNPLHVRQIKQIALDYERLPRTIVMVGHAVDVPPELAKLTAPFILAMPNSDAIERLVREEVLAWQAGRPGKEVKSDKDSFTALLNQLAGLSESDIRRLLRELLGANGELSSDDVAALGKRKHALLSQDSVLSFESNTERFAEVAGLANLKAWLARRKPVFLGSDPGLDSLDVPKGLMLLGVQGCGKSMAAKAVAGSWSVPLLRLDFGALYNKFLGETERNLREALRVADAMAPCVLWMDEIEKGVSSSGNSSDGGESRRVLGTILTWMAERKSRVFVVATSNDIEALPPELVRKGRLDEIFFVDLPSPHDRQEIFKIHLKRRKQLPEDFDLALLSEKSTGFSGAEIEQAVIAALYESRTDATQTQGSIGKLTLQHLLSEIARTKPLSVVMAEKIAYLRAWAADRTVRADD
jgi:SpoVK/Ycf46/Vps4 family AAA+-type ATPase